jgi:hypothetical protein
MVLNVVKASALAGNVEMVIGKRQICCIACDQAALWYAGAMPYEAQLVDRLDADYVTVDR